MKIYCWKWVHFLYYVAVIREEESLSWFLKHFEYRKQMIKAVNAIYQNMRALCAFLNEGNISKIFHSFWSENEALTIYEIKITEQNPEWKWKEWGVCWTTISGKWDLVLSLLLPSRSMYSKMKSYQFELNLLCNRVKWEYLICFIVLTMYTR